ncbi:MAG: DUF935 family protein [Magnetococcales bacterium]|nr:DUF935 family protein [Magnetococcales bacterium]
MPAPNVPGTPLFREVASTDDGRDITREYWSSMELRTPQDSVLQDKGGDYTVYEEVLRDDQVASTLQQRRLAVTSAEWGVRPGGNDRQSLKAADHLRQTLESIGWDGITEKMLYGVFFGYAVAECLWDRAGSEVVLSGIKVRKQRRFAFDEESRLRLLLRDNPKGELLPARKFWHFCTGADNDDEPYGLGLAHWLYWPVYFKRNGIRLWLIFMDKFGMPTAKGIYPTNASEEEKRRLLSALRAIQTDSGIIIPEGMQIELIEASRGGQVHYEAFIDRMNAAISKVVLSQTLTTDAAGGRYKSEVQKSVRNEVVRADADLVCDSFNRTVARWLTEWNHPGAQLPHVWRLVREESDLLPRAERDKVLFSMGFKPTLAYVQETYGGHWTEVATDLPSR